MNWVKRLGLVAAGAAFVTLLMGPGTAPATMLCTAEPTVKEENLHCPEKTWYGVDLIPGQDIEGGLFTNSTFVSTEGPAGTVTCSESNFVAGIMSEGGSEPGEGIMSTFFRSGVGNDCSSTLNGAEQPQVFVTPENLSYDGTKVVYKQAPAPQGTLTIAKAGGAVQIKMNVTAKTPLTCIYKLQGKEELTGKWSNTTTGIVPTKIAFTKVKFEKSFGFGCPTKVEFSATYIVRPTFFPLGHIYLAKD